MDWENDKTNYCGNCGQRLRQISQKFILKLREILKSIWEDFLDAIQDVYLLYKIRFPKDSKVDIYGWINQAIYYLTPILLVMIIALKGWKNNESN